MIGNIETATIQDLHTTDDGNIRSNFFMSFEKWLEKKAVDRAFDISITPYIEQKERDEKYADFKSKKMVELENWVLENTDKRGTKAKILAKRIFNKHYV